MRKKDQAEPRWFPGFTAGRAWRRHVMTLSLAEEPKGKLLDLFLLHVRTLYLGIAVASIGVAGSFWLWKTGFISPIVAILVGLALMVIGVISAAFNAFRNGVDIYWSLQLETIIRRLRRRSFSGIVGRAVTRRHTLVLTGLGSLIAGCWLLDGPSWFLVFNALMAGWYAIDTLVVQYRVAAGIYGETAPEVLAAANFVIRKRGGRSGGGGHFDKVFETAADTASNISTVYAPGGAVAR